MAVKRWRASILLAAISATMLMAAPAAAAPTMQDVGDFGYEFGPAVPSAFADSVVGAALLPPTVTSIAPDDFTTPVTGPITLVATWADVPAAVDAPDMGTAGQSVAVEDEGFAPNGTIEIWLHSTPVLLATVTADATGAGAGTVSDAHHDHHARCDHRPVAARHDGCGHRGRRDARAGPARDGRGAERNPTLRALTLIVAVAVACSPASERGAATTHVIGI